MLLTIVLILLVAYNWFIVLNEKDVDKNTRNLLNLLIVTTVCLGIISLLYGVSCIMNIHGGMLWKYII